MSQNDAFNPESFKEFLDNMHDALSKIEIREKMERAELECICEFCGRCVLAGPPCCYDKLYKMYNDVVSERDWLRKIQSKNAKRINNLEKLLASKEK